MKSLSAKIGTYLLLVACVLSVLLPVLLFLSVSVIAMALIISNSKTISYPKTWMIWGGVYIVSIMFNCMYSEYPDVSSSFLTNTVTHILIATIFACSVNTKEDYINVLRFFVLSGVIASVIVLYQERSTIFFLPLGTESFGGGNIPFTYILIPTSMSCLFLILEDKKRYYFVVMLFILFVSLLTTSRKAFFLPILFFLLYSFFHNRKQFSKLFVYMLVGGGVLTVVLIIFIHYDYLSSLSVDRLTTLISFYEEGTGDESLERREDLIQKGLLYIFNRPLFGYGMGTYSVVIRSIVYSHNNYIETLFGGGIIMLMIYYFIHFFIIRGLWREKSNIAHFFLSATIVYLVSDYGTVSYYIYPQLFILAMASSVSEKNKISIFRK